MPCSQSFKLLQAQICTVCELIIEPVPLDRKLVAFLKYHICPCCLQQVLEVDQTIEYKRRFWKFLAEKGVPK